MRLFVATIFVVLLSAPLVSASFDWWTLVTESLLQTDLWQTEEVYWTTKDNQRCFSKTVCLYESNPIVAGRDWEEILVAAEILPRALEQFVPEEMWSTYAIARVAVQTAVVINNNQSLSAANIAPRYMISYRWIW